jgi:hypothetical protein
MLGRTDCYGDRMIRVKRRRVRWAAGVGLALTAMLVAVLAVPTSAIAGDSPALPDGSTTGIVRFRLPSLDRSRLDPNALNIARAAAKPAPLLLFLPATGAVPENYQDFLMTAYSAGYSVLGLDYWNRGKSVASTCGANAGCYTSLQQNRFNGTDPTRFSRVNEANSILHRLRAALDYLKHNNPHGGWDRYLAKGGQSIRWSRIVLAGHSQGGGESAFISHFHSVKGVLMFSSPVETFKDVSASWMEKPGVTPASRMYGFDTTGDMFYARIIGSWQKLGMGTASGAAATRTPSGSHVLLSSLYVGNAQEAHDRTVSDGTARNPDGAPVYEPVWKWMLAQVR